MGNIFIKNLPKLRLIDLLRRRKMTLEAFILGFGITTYDNLVDRCAKMGVAAPDKKQTPFFIEATRDELVSDQQEGIVVFEPSQVVVEQDPVQQDADTDSYIEVTTSESATPSQKKQKKKRETPVDV